MVLVEDIGPMTTNERLYASFTLFIGAFGFAVVLGKILVAITEFDAGLNEFLNKKSLLQRNMAHAQLPEALQEKVLQYYDYTWHRFRGKVGLMSAV